MAPTRTIFQSSDLNRSGRAFIDAARAGEALLRDKDGTSLVMLVESRLRALATIADATGNLLAIEMAAAKSESGLPAVHELGDWVWLRALDADDLREFVQELRTVLLVASREESAEPIDRALFRWRATAQALVDPVMREVVLGGGFRQEDFVEVSRPEQTPG